MSIMCGDIVISAFVSPESDPIKGVITRITDQHSMNGTKRYVYVSWVSRDGHPDANDSCYEDWQVKVIHRRSEEK